VNKAVLAVDQGADAYARAIAISGNQGFRAFGNFDQRLALQMVLEQ
jgi:hypothetical protein